MAILKQFFEKILLIIQIFLQRNLKNTTMNGQPQELINPLQQELSLLNLK